MIPQDEFINLAGWSLFCDTVEPEESQELMEYVNKRNALIIQSNRITAHETLKKNGWYQQAELSEDYLLWLKDKNFVPPVAEETETSSEAETNPESENEEETTPASEPASPAEESSSGS
ncbi:MAG: hypothetical protein R3C11_05560 [Planctomycetaceae bacterium]